jgi:hypothetical protein
MRQNGAGDAPLPTLSPSQPPIRGIVLQRQCRPNRHRAPPVLSRFTIRHLFVLANVKPDIVRERAACRRCELIGRGGIE